MPQQKAPGRTTAPDRTPAYGDRTVRDVVMAGGLLRFPERGAA